MTDRKYLEQFFEFAVILTNCVLSADQLVYCREQIDDFCVATNDSMVYNKLCEEKKNRKCRYWLTVVYIKKEKTENEIKE